MTDISTTPDIVTRTGADAVKNGALKRQRSPAAKVGGAAIWTALMIAGALTLIPISRYAEQEIQTWTLLHANQAGIRDAIAGDWAQSASADYVEAVSELSLDLPKADTGTAFAAAQRATTLDASRAHAWATLAWLEYSKA